MTIKELETMIETDILVKRLNELKSFQIKELPEIVKEYRRSIEVGINSSSQQAAMFRVFDGLDILICLDILSTYDEKELVGKDRTSPMLAFGIYTSNTKEGAAESKKFNELKVSEECHNRIANIIEDYYKDNYKEN